MALISKPVSKQLLYPSKKYITLYLNTFQEDPASSILDWHFTPNHSSSADFSTSVCSNLHTRVIKVSFWPWLDRIGSGLKIGTFNRFIKTRFRSGSNDNRFNLATTSNSQVHSSTGTLLIFPKDQAWVDCQLLGHFRFHNLFHSA